jgi:hypothetical protein
MFKVNFTKFVAVIGIIEMIMIAQAQAGLIDRGNGLIYDSNLNITWMQDANYAQTSGYDNDGRMTWREAMSWADSLDYGGFKNWRLPNMDRDSDGIIEGVCSSGVQSSLDNEFGILFGCSYWKLGLQGANLFINVQPGNHWSLNTYKTIDHLAWQLNNCPSGRCVNYKAIPANTWAVHDGDVGALDISAPSTAALFGIGLASLVLTRRRAFAN